MPLSQQSLGLLMSAVEFRNSQASLGAFLLTLGLAGGDPGVVKGTSQTKRIYAALSVAQGQGLTDELLRAAESVLKDVQDDARAPEWVPLLRASLRRDGFESTPTLVETSGYGRAKITWVISELGLIEIPISPLVSDLASLLIQTGFPVAAGHYRQALTGFRDSNWATSNSQLRSTFESVLLDVAVSQTGTRFSGGGAALDALQKTLPLPFGPNEYVRGLWKMSHPDGSHPGLSNEEEARHRIYAISTLIGWFVRSYA